MSLYVLWAKVKSLFAGRRELQDLREEIETHLAMEMEEAASKETDVSTVKRRFGNRTAIGESSYDAWTFGGLESFVWDVRYALRGMRRNPWHTGFAISALAIGIGGATGGFSVVNALLLSSLPFHEPDRLAAFHPNEFIPPHDNSTQFHEWRQRSKYLSNAALVEEKDVNLGGGREAIRAHAARVSWNLFATLGTSPGLGRAFMEGEDNPGRNGVAVISYGLWQQLFGAEANAVGSTIRVDGTPLTIIGVAQAGFDYPHETAVWQPAEFSAGNNGWATVARLEPGITWPQARAAFDADVERLRSDAARLDPKSPRPQMRPLQSALVGPSGDASLMLMAGMVLVLLIACTNVANLLMARIAGRTPELSIRSALGASRRRIIQQLLTECLILSTVAGLAGFLLASGITSIAAKVQPPPLAAMSYSILDARVVIFSLAVSLLTGLLFGVFPAASIGQVHAFETRDSNTTRGAALTTRVLTVTQVTLTIILLTASLSVGRAFAELMKADRGYNADGIVTVNVSLEGTRYETDKRQLQYFEEVLARLRSLPGIRSASATEFLPLYSTGFVGGGFGVDGRRANRSSTLIPTMAGYIQTMGGRVITGREFTDAEVHSGSRVAVVNERFAAAFGGPEEVLGRQLTAGRQSGWKIVGVAKGMEFETDPSVSNSNQVLLPVSSPGGFFSTFVARVDGRADVQVAAIREAILSVDPQVPVFGAKTMEQRLTDFYIRPRAYRSVVWMFAAFSMLLALIGMFGIVSHAVVQRMRELGLRMALGATPAEVRRMILIQNLSVVAVGAFLGIVSVGLAGRFFGSVILGAKPVSLVTSAALALALAIAASITIWMATRRITQVDIMELVRTAK